MTIERHCERVEKIKIQNKRRKKIVGKRERDRGTLNLDEWWNFTPPEIKRAKQMFHITFST